MTFEVYMFFKFNFYLFLERGRKEKEREEKYQCVVAFHTPPIGDLACNPGICPDWELNWQPFGSQAGTQSTEPHQPGLLSVFSNHIVFSWQHPCWAPASSCSRLLWVLSGLLQTPLTILLETPSASQGGASDCLNTMSYLHNFSSFSFFPPAAYP